VCELFAGHAAGLEVRKMRARSRWVSTPANGSSAAARHPLSDPMSWLEQLIDGTIEESRPLTAQRAAMPRGCAAMRRRRFTRADAGSALDRFTSRLATGWWSQRLRPLVLVSLPAVFSPSLSLRRRNETDSAGAFPTDEYPRARLSQRVRRTCCPDDP